ncbi:MAG: hypothetical protein KGL39_17185 [Patescibacteria group bacterium]|nr:hypothetical protein [Patescibacteria group bacterium]
MGIPSSIGHRAPNASKRARRTWKKLEPLLHSLGIEGLIVSTHPDESMSMEARSRINRSVVQVAVMADGEARFRLVRGLIPDRMRRLNLSDPASVKSLENVIGHVVHGWEVIENRTHELLRTK